MDSSFADNDSLVWRSLLEPKISFKLKQLMLTVDPPASYVAFVTLCRKLDVRLRDLAASQPPRRTAIATVPALPRPQTTAYAPPQRRAILPPATVPTAAAAAPTTSQGGNAMDLDELSKERGLNGKPTQRAREARLSLGRCFYCNEAGHLAVTCPIRIAAATATTPRLRAASPAATITAEPFEI